MYSAYQLNIGAGAFKQVFVTHRKAVTTSVKKTSRTIECNGREKEEMLKEDLERNLTLCLHDSFCRNRESNVDPLPGCKQRVEEQKWWRTASNSVRTANAVLQDTDAESAESILQEEEMAEEQDCRQMAEEQDAKRKKLEKFRSVRTSKRQKKKKQRSDEREEIKTQNCFVSDKKLK